MEFTRSRLRPAVLVKDFSSLHERVRLQLKKYLDSGFLPGWLTRGRTSLLQKDQSKGNVASNYGPTTCLPLMWKLLTGVITDQIYSHLDQEKLLPEEQKGTGKARQVLIICFMLIGQ